MSHQSELPRYFDYFHGIQDFFKNVLPFKTSFPIFTARKRSLGQGNIFTPVCHSVHRGGMRGCSGGACMVASEGVRAWLLWGHGCSWGCAWLLQGACMVALGGMCGCSGWACMVAPGGHVWLLRRGGGGACNTTRYGDTINERVVRILLECILVRKYFCCFDGRPEF